MTERFKLYNYDLDEHCYKVRLLLAVLHVEVEQIAVDVFPGKEQEKPEFLDLNPLGRLPVLQDDGLILFGTEAILAHLGRNHDLSGRYLPEYGKSFARTMQWLNFSAHDLEVTSLARQQAIFDAPGEPSFLKGQSKKMLRIMDDAMTVQMFDGFDFFAGAHATIADIALFPAFALSRDYGLDHDEFPALRRWARRIRNLPGFITMPGIPHYH
ncbi:MAG: glutathione S-transferase family protein [Pseudomonadota bacterium]